MSTSTISLERVLADTVRDYLVANRPASVPETHGIVAEHDHDPEDRPYTLIRVPDVKWDHPKWGRCLLQLETRMRVDEQGSTSDPASDEAVPGHHVDLGGVVNAGLMGMQAILQPRGAWLRRITPAPPADQPEGERGRRMTRSWYFHLQIGAPADSPQLAVYDFSTLSRASQDDNDTTTANDYVGGTIGVAPSAVTNTGTVAYTTGAETPASPTHSFTVNLNGTDHDLQQLVFDYQATNIDFRSSSFSYDLTSNLTGATVLASETFTSTRGGTADFSVSEAVDLSVVPALQGISGLVTFTFTFTDNSSGSGRSHGISNVTLTATQSAP